MELEKKRSNKRLRCASYLLILILLFVLAPSKGLIIGGTVGGIIAVLIGVGVVVLAMWYKYILYNTLQKECSFMRKLTNIKI